MSIDWRKAPEGTTHYHIAEDINPWRKIEGTVAYEHYRGKWLRVNSFNEGCMPGYYVPIPQETWNGQGLPPVGTVCIVEPHNTMWGFSSTSGHERKILAYYGEYVWLGHAETPLETTRIDKVDFRPIRTPEQIAADERSKECDRIFAILLSVGQEGNMAEAIYDAGYRRQEEGK
ncbi:TPA: hypothetical protein L4S42_006091 [Pseudomonas aeruginosa]|nr:hypothetical protein [Pseudomonas aeruginosa]